MTRNQELNIRFYIQECDKNGTLKASATRYDLEADFDGLMYSEAKGLSNKGKVKNTFSETYADSDRLRVYHPLENGVKREATTVTFTFYFTGENRRATFNSFCNYISGGFRAYWDTARNKKLVFYAPNDCTVSEELWHGSTPYIKAEITVQNIFGDTTDIVTP